MIQKELLEQIDSLFKIFVSNKNIVLIGILAFISFILLEIVSHLRSKKIVKIILVSIYVLVFGILLIFYNTEILSFIDYLINNVFILFFFPNLAVYTLIIIISNVFVIRTLLGRNNKILKNISIIFFILFNIIFYLIIDNCLTNNVLVYETLSIYTNSDLLTLIQVSMYLFILYLIIILIAKVSGNIIGSMKVKERVVKPKEVPSIVVKEDRIPNISSIPEIIPDTTPNTLVITPEEVLKPLNSLVLNNQEINNLKTVNVYNEYMDIEPVKKKKIQLSNMDEIFVDDNMNHDMDIVFGNISCLNNIMNDVLKLRGNINNENQIRKIYDQITINSKRILLRWNLIIQRSLLR